MIIPLSVLSLGPKSAEKDMHFVLISELSPEISLSLLSLILRMAGKGIPSVLISG